MSTSRTPGPMYVGFDGPSRPIIHAGNHTLLSVSKFQDGRWCSYDEEGADCSLFAAAFNSYDKHCGPRAVECAEADLLGEALDALRRGRMALGTCLGPLKEWTHAHTFPEVIDAEAALVEIDAVLAKATRR